MSALSKILRSATDGRLTWWCPGCNGAHQVPAAIRQAPVAVPDPGYPDWTPPHEYYEARDGAWSWNGSATRPTFQPSVLVRYEGTDAGKDGAPPAVCHSFVVDGRMQFLGDCTHALAGQTVPIPEWPRPNYGGV